MLRCFSYFFHRFLNLDIYTIVLDPTKIHNELGWLPETKFADGIKMTIQWYLDNRDWWEEIISGEYQNYYEKMYGDKDWKDLERPSSTRLEARVPSHGSGAMTRCHSRGDPTSLAPHERLTDLAVVPREKPHTGAAAREQPRDSPVIET